ncbi:MAG TPA: bacillithiol biosynthesis cysteine-adding enzyme BshC [Candidatus Deferrimicrobium sp.]|nr:bacillithiol biosynthesis cysteine-adding enzyme BshC [Candidatus Deferrimicrobium sp.]
MTDLVHPAKSLGYSDLYLDFLSGKDTIRQFFCAARAEDVAHQLDRRSYARDSMAEILSRQNRLFGASDATFSYIERLRQTDTVCIFAGQQAGLFGGPMLVIIKALAIVKAAHDWSARLKRPVVPIFWIAGDDHDFGEINHTWVLNRDGGLAKVSYESSPVAALPAARIRFSDASELEKAITLLRESLGQTDFTPDLYRLIENAYTPDDTFVSAFGKLMARLTGQFGLILFSPADDEVKQLAAPLFKEFLNRRRDLQAAIADTNRRLRNDGYHTQVYEKEDSTHLFCDLDGRKLVTFHGEDFLVGEKGYTAGQLAEVADKNPERLSPDVLLRPVLQSYLFPVLLQMGGPSEIAYFAQCHRLFEIFGLTAPFYAARPSATLVEKRFEALLREESIALEELSGDIEQLINRVLARSFPEDLDKRFEQLRHDLGHRFNATVEESLMFDPSLKQFAAQTHGKLDFTLKQFAEKVFVSHKKKSKESRDRLYRLGNALYPNRTLQERSLNIACFLSRYGFDILRFMYDRIDVNETAHQLVNLSELGS